MSCLHVAHCGCWLAFPWPKTSAAAFPLPCACIIPAPLLSCPTGPSHHQPLPKLTVHFLFSEQASQHDLSPKPQQDVAADSNTPDLLELCSQDSPKRLLQAEPVQTSSPSLLCSYRNTSLVGTSATQATSAAEPACTVPCPAPAPQVSGGSPATLPSLSPVFPVLPSSRLQSLPEGTPHREQADSSGTDFPPDTLECGPARARTQGGDAGGTKRKLVVKNGQQHPRGAPWGRGKDTGRSGEYMSTRAAKKSRKEPGKELSEEEEDERASPVSGPSSRPEQRRPLQPVKMKQLLGSPAGFSLSPFC